MQITKRLLPNGGSKALLLPKIWLNDHGNPDTVNFDLDSGCVSVPAKSVAAKQMEAQK